MEHFTLELVLAGLIALVPSQDGTKLTILLVESRSEFTASDGTKIPPHRPLLTYSCDDRPNGVCTASESMPANLALLAKTWGRTPFPSSTNTGVLPLEGVEISLGGDFSVDPGFRMVTQDRLRFDFDGSPKHTIPQTGESRDVSWIADMRRVSPTVAKANAACVNDQVPPTDRVVARGSFLNGELSVKKLLFGGDASFGFLPLQATGGLPRAECSCGQALADRTALALNVKGCSASIIIKQFGQASELYHIDLSPKDCDTNPNTKVTVYLSNRMECAQWDLSTDPPTCLDEHAQPDHDKGQHFEIYYKISDPVPSLTKRPVPLMILKPQAGGDGDDRPICPQPRFSAP